MWGEYGTEWVDAQDQTTVVAYPNLLNEYLILLAWKDFIFRRYSVLWEKAGSTR
jgi:hypothetical protein